MIWTAGMFASTGIKGLKLLMQKIIGNKKGTIHYYPIYDKMECIKPLQDLNNFIHNSCVHLFQLTKEDISAYIFGGQTYCFTKPILTIKSQFINIIIMNQLLFLNEVITIIQHNCTPTFVCNDF
jgi:hypothetical protein